MAEAEAAALPVILLGLVPIHVYNPSEKAQRQLEKETVEEVQHMKMLLSREGIAVTEIIRSGFPDEESTKVVGESDISMVLVAGGRKPSELANHNRNGRNIDGQIFLEVNEHRIETHFVMHHFFDCSISFALMPENSFQRTMLQYYFGPLDCIIIWMCAGNRIIEETPAPFLSDASGVKAMRLNEAQPDLTIREFFGLGEEG